MMQTRIWGTTDGFVEGGDVLGRKVANATFLRALLTADPFDAYHFFLESDAARAGLEEWLAGYFPALFRRGAFGVFLRSNLPGSLEQTDYHCFHLSDCIVRPAHLARLRNTLARRICPITSVTHSLSYERFMPAFLSLLWEGTCARDAVVATSRSVESMLDAVFSGLCRHYSIEGEICRPRIARIPLGVIPEDFPAPEQHWTEDRGAAARRMRSRLGIGDEVLFLSLARISPYSKMDSLPLVAALKRAETLGLPPGGHALALAGWTDEGDALPEALAGYANSLGLRLIPVLRPTEEERGDLYAAADVFLSPSDNIQESFGLTIAEAGVCGLPVIASDFDGYRDIVLHGVTGLLVPTLGFADTGETEALAGMWFDNQYHLKLAQQTVVDIPALADALAWLGADADVRRSMGRAARKRIVEEFSWSPIISRYVALWEELSAVPMPSEQERRLRGAAHPLAMPFARAFRGHFTKVLDAGTAKGLTLRRTPAGDDVYRQKSAIPRYAGMEGIVDEQALRQLLLAARKPMGADTLLAALARNASHPPAVAGERAAFLILWALKHDLLEIA